MILNVAISEAYNLVMIFDTDPDSSAPPGVELIKIDIPPDNVKELIDKYIENEYNIIVTPLVVKRCGLKEKDFQRHVRDGSSATKIGSVHEITSTLLELERRRLEGDL